MILQQQDDKHYLRSPSISFSFSLRSSEFVTAKLAFRPGHMWSGWNVHEGETTNFKLVLRKRL
jgi:hypothetical protein